MDLFEAPIDAASGVPYYRQVIDRVLLGVADGSVRVGDRLPTVRSLAVALQINPNTVGRAYRDLEAMGAVETRRGAGTFIAALTPRKDENERQRQLEDFCGQVVLRALRLGFSGEELVGTIREIARAADPSSRPRAVRGTESVAKGGFGSAVPREEEE